MKKQYLLIIFDMNGTLTNTPFIDKQPLHLLPGRKERCRALSNRGITLAIASNQGGVAFGFTSETLAKYEVATIAEQIGTKWFRVAYGHPKPKTGYEQYASSEHLAMRKPAPGMLIAIMKNTHFAPHETLMVGDREEDEQAAKNAGCDFMWAKDFFGED